MTLSRRSLSFGLLAAAATSRLAQAQSLPAPSERVILTVTGKISVTNSEQSARFDRRMLEQFGSQGFIARTPWYAEPVRFDGVRMSTLLRAVGASGDTVIATALNDYETCIPVSDFTEFEVLLALKRDGEYMAVRDKGPLFIVYPYDSDPVLKHQRFYSRSAWQVVRMVVL